MSGQGNTDGDDVLAGLRPTHPRLLVDSAEVFERLKKQRIRDGDLNRLLSAAEWEANRLLDQPPLERALIGRRMLDVSREAIGRVLALALSYRITGREEYALRAEKELLAVCGFADWNPSHFLDVGEMALAVSLGYDWLYDALPDETRRTLRCTLMSHAVGPALAEDGPDSPAQYRWWTEVTNNWNPVCYGGLTAAALCVAESDPEAARGVLALTRRHNPASLEAYAPDGVYPEGPSYWVYGSSYQAMLIAMLDSALGTDWGLSDAEGFERSAEFMWHVFGATGRSYNFSDATLLERHPEVLLWFARRFGRPGLASRVIREVQTHGPNTVWFKLMAAVWWPNQPAEATEPLPLTWLGHGDVPLAVFREAWNDPKALYLAAKGGKASNNHGHMDAGSFVMEADGVRWAIDLGAQDYHSLESKGMSIFGKSQDAERWDIYRLNHLSHNTLSIDGQPHRVDGSATLTRFIDEGGRWSATFDLSPVFEGQAEAVQRCFDVWPSRGVRITDTLSGLAQGASVEWAMMTEAGVEIQADERSAALRQDGGTLRLTIDTPADTGLQALPATPHHPEYDAPNPGVTRISFKTTADANGEMRIVTDLMRGA